MSLWFFLGGVFMFQESNEVFLRIDVVIKSVGFYLDTVVRIVFLQSRYLVNEIRNPIGNLRMNQVEKFQRSVGHSY